MRIEVNRRRARGLASGIAFIVSNCVQVSLLVAPIALAGQSRSSKEPTNAITQTRDNAGFDRPRRAETQRVTQLSSSELGPIIRVALMTDVASVSLSSSNDLVVHRQEEKDGDGKKIGGSLRAELRRRAAPSVESVYRVQVATTSESRRARTLSDELKKHFFEPVTTSFDESKKDYSVLIGKFESRSEAVGLVKRLRSAGYDEPRVVADPLTAFESSANTNARNANAKHKAQPSSAEHAGKTSNSVTQIVVLAADKQTVSSSDELIVAPAAAGKNERIDSKESRDQADSIAPTRAVRVDGKDYRGEIHLVLNPRGRINVVNALAIEEYLRGVVPVELSPGHFPEIEALKAQAVAARSYALARMGRHSDDGFDLVDDTRAQVYGGLSVERELTNRAVDETRGVVAMFPNADGKLIPIEAMYTANCGGRTENNEEVFGGTALPYLRGVACSPDARSLDAHEITTRRTAETLTGAEGRSIAREVGLLSVLGFALPRRPNVPYLRNSSDQGELKGWLEMLAQFTQKEKPKLTRDITRLADFVRAVAVSIFGEGRASTLLAPADVDYVLTGLPVQQVPRDDRAEVALLLRDGILHLPGGVVDWRATVTRGQALEILARAVSSGPQSPGIKSQTLLFSSDIAAGAQKGRLMIAKQSSSTNESASRATGSRYATTNTSSRVSRQVEDKSREVKPTTSTANVAASRTKDDDANSGALEIAEDAWLFRKLGDASYAVDRLSLAGGERVTYHLNKNGLVDFLEASVSDRGAASDRFTNIAQWQERLAISDLQQRLAAARINVGTIENIEPVSFSSSSRVTEVEITGNKGQARIRRPQIRSVLGLKEYLFVVDRETDEQGLLVAFVFTGRGWGHGVGMCQVGAYGLAKEGYSFSAILQKYYTGIKLQKMY
jgi:peptidoglycan hydrolase-like amidase